MGAEDFNEGMSYERKRILKLIDEHLKHMNEKDVQELKVAIGDKRK